MDTQFNLLKKMDDIEIRLTNLESVLKNLDTRLLNIDNVLKDVVKSSSKMSSHIDFVEETYETLKFPINYVKTSIEKYVGYDNNKELPTIQDKNHD